MKIEVLKMKNFRKFKNFTLRFSEGVNLIYGPNESGKSTVIDAIITLFYGDPKSRSREVLNNKNWTAEELFRIEMEFREYDTPLSLVKDFQMRKVSFRSSDKETGSIEKVDNAMARILGIDSPDVYVKTACIKQDELSEIKKLPARLEQFIMDGVDITKVLRKVDERRKYLKVERSGRGIIPELSVRIEELEKKRTELKRKLDECRSVLERLYIVQDKLSSQSEVYERMKLKMDLESELKEIDKRIDELHKKREEFRRTEIRKEKIKEQLNQFDGVGDDIKELERIEREKDKLSKKGDVRKYLLGLLVTMLVVGFVPISLVSKASIVAFITAIFSSIAIWGRYKIGKEKESLNKSFYSLLAKRRVGGVEELRELEADRNKLVIEFARLEERLKQFSPEEIEKELYQLQTKKERILKEFEPLKYILVDPAELYRMEKEVPLLSEEKDKLERRVEVLSELIKEETTVMELEEELDSLKAEMERLERNYKIYSLLYTKLEETKQRLVMEISNKLNEKMEKYISRFTKGRYTRVRCIPANKGGIQIMVYSNEKKDWVNAEDLSTGTTEQIYLATRLVFLETIVGGRKPPIILDDPFAFFDENRLLAVFETLKELATEYQVLLFTCNPGYIKYFPKAIKMEMEEKAMEV